MQTVCWSPMFLELPPYFGDFLQSLSNWLPVRSALHALAPSLCKSSLAAVCATTQENKELRVRKAYTLIAPFCSSFLWLIGQLPCNLSRADAEAVGFLEILHFHYLLCKTDVPIILEVTRQDLDELNIFYGLGAAETLSDIFKAKGLQ